MKSTRRLIAIVLTTILLPMIASASAPQGNLFFSVTPCRILDTRDAGGTPNVPLTLGKVPLVSGTLYLVRLQGHCGIPDGATAISLNATIINVINPSNQGFLTLWPAGTPFPNISTLNTNANVAEDYTIVNHAIVPLAQGAGNDLSILLYAPPSGSTDLFLDVDGYFAPASTPEDADSASAIARRVKEE